MRKFRLYDGSGARNKDFQFHDRISKEHIFIGGTDSYIYRYLGPKSEESDDLTKPDFTELGAIESDIADLVWMENASRSYDKNPVILPITYQVEDPNMFLMQFGFLNQNTLTMTVHYNQMVELIGRKLMNGDVLELPHLRDYDLLGQDEGVNRFYVVHDTFRPSSGYSPTWLPHLYSITVAPLQDSPEYSDLLGDAADEDSLSSKISTKGANETIMDVIMAQQEAEVPFMHYDNEHIYDEFSDANLEDGENANTTANNLNDQKDQRSSPLPPRTIDDGEAFPSLPTDGQWFKRTDFTPDRIYQFDDGLQQWVSYDYGGRKPHVGPNQQLADFVNNNESDDDETSRVGVGDIIKPNFNF